MTNQLGPKVPPNVRWGRKLCDAIPAKLEFDYACQRGNAFGELYLHGIINEVVAANIDSSVYKVHLGYPHTVLNAPKPATNQANSGRRKEIDFYIAARQSGSHLLPPTAMEVKWAGSSHTNPHTLLTDLCRLTLIAAAQPDTACFFVLAGRLSEVTKLIDSRLLRTTGARGRLVAAPTPPGGKQKKPRTHDVADLLNAGFQLDAATLPTRPMAIRTQAISLPNVPLQRWVAHVWRVTAP